MFVQNEPTIDRPKNTSRQLNAEPLRQSFFDVKCYPSGSMAMEYPHVYIGNIFSNNSIFQAAILGYHSVQYQFAYPTPC